MSVSRRRYVIAAILLMALEVLIALFVHDGVIRPYVGDSLVVMLLYATLRATTRLDRRTAVATAFLVACAVEVSQYVHLVDRLGLGNSAVARTLLGTQFAPADFIAYFIGALTALAADWSRARRMPRQRG